MKTLLKKATVLLLLWIPISMYSQGREHEGFYLSMQAGSAMGYINGNSNQQSSMEVNGTGIAFDFQIGGIIRENQTLHGVIGIKSISGPEISMNGQSGSLSQDFSFDEIIIGGGTTYYFKNNFFVTGNIGMGNFSFTDMNDNTSVATDYGFTFQLKAGKEWWISPRWGLGALLEYGGTRSKDQLNDYKETWQSHRYSVRLTATLNGKK